MYAIIRDRGKQYKVSPGDSLLIDFMGELKGRELEFNEVIAVGQEGSTRLGTPLLEGVKVVAEVKGTRKGERLRATKFRRRENYRRKLGHRQLYTQVKIKEIVL